MIFIMGLIIVGFISIVVFAWLDYREILKFEKSEKVRWEDTEKLLEDSKKQRDNYYFWHLFDSWTNRREK